MSVYSRGKVLLVVRKGFSFYFLVHNSPSSYYPTPLFAFNVLKMGFSSLYFHQQVFEPRSCWLNIAEYPPLPPTFCVESSSSDYKNESRRFLRRHCFAAVVPTTFPYLAHLVDTSSTLCHHGWIQLSKCGGSDYQT